MISTFQIQVNLLIKSRHFEQYLEPELRCKYKCTAVIMHCEVFAGIAHVCKVKQNLPPALAGFLIVFICYYLANWDKPILENTKIWD